MASLLPLTRLRLASRANTKSIESLRAISTLVTPAGKPYRLRTTASNNLPIYELKKRGGNMKLTKIRNIEGDLKTFRQDIQAALGLKEDEVVINPVTKHVVVKGLWKHDIKEFITSSAAL